MTRQEEGGVQPADDGALKPAEHGSLKSYYHCIRYNPYFIWLWVAECVNTMGSWFNYVATLTLVEHATNSSGLALSGIVLLHFLPMLLLGPMAGAVADTQNRVRILVTAAVLDAGISLLLIPVASHGWLVPLYVLLLLQFSAWSFYNPSRAAMIPVVVHPDCLPAATTIDGFAWSLTTAVGASAGGFVSSRYGIVACFAIDGLTYLLGALIALRIPRALGDPHAGAGAAHRLGLSVLPPGSRMPELEADSTDLPAPSAGHHLPPLPEEESDQRNGAVRRSPDRLVLAHSGLPDTPPSSSTGLFAPASRPFPVAEAVPGLSEPIARRKTGGEGVMRAELGSGAATLVSPFEGGSLKSEAKVGSALPSSPTGAPPLPSGDHAGLPGAGSGLVSPRAARGAGIKSGLSLASGAPASHSAAFGPHASLPPTPSFPRQFSHVAAAAESQRSGLASLALPRLPLRQRLAAAVAESWESTLHGLRFVTARANRDVLLMMLMKACGSATWGPVDIFSVKFSEMPSMQGLGDATFTMGLIFSAVGLGCTLGPFVFNPFTAPTKASLTAAVAASLACLAVGYWAMLQATNVYTMILAQTVRAMGSAVLWIDSSLLLQLRVPNAVLGRVAALELAAYTVAEGTSSLLGGLSFDALHWTLHQSVLAVAVLATGIAAAWAVIAHGTWRAARAAAYKPLADRDEVGERGLEAGLELATRQL